MMSIFHVAVANVTTELRAEIRIQYWTLGVERFPR
jgi:hypothetical protein